MILQSAENIKICIKQKMKNTIPKIKLLYYKRHYNRDYKKALIKAG